MFSDQALSDIAHKLKAANEGKDIAVAEDTATQGTIHYTVRAARTGKEPYTAAVKLMQIGKQLKLNIRKPIVSTAALAEMDKGMARVTANRVIVALQAGNVPVILPPTVAPTTPHTKVTVLQPAEIVGWEERDNDLASFRVPDLVSPGVDIRSETRTTDHTGMHTVHRIYMMAAYALMTSRISGRGAQWAAGKNIGVLLVDATGKILACGVNTNTLNGTFHAEVNCLQSYYRFNKNGFGGFPADARLYSTLEPCEMCAGMIWETAADPTKFLVYYGMVDPNQLAQKTKLSKEKRERLLSQWQEVSYMKDKYSRDPRAPVGSANEKERKGPKAIKLYEQTTGPTAYQLIYSDYARYLETHKGTYELSAADFMTNPRHVTANPNPARDSIPKVNQSLMRKVTKYTTVNATDLNPNVKKVVLHVRDFLKQMGVVGF